MDCLRKETVSVSGRSGAQSSVASIRRYQFREGVSWMWGSRVILTDLLLTLDEYSSWRVWRVVPMIRSAVCWGQIWWLSWTRQLLTCRGWIQWWRSRTVSAAPVAGWTSSAGEGSITSAGPFSQWTQCDCPTSSPKRWWCTGIWMTPLQSQCCSWWWVGGEQRSFSWSTRSSPLFWAC